MFNNPGYTNDIAELLTSPELEKSYLLENDKRLENFVAAVKYAQEINPEKSD